MLALIPARGESKGLPKKNILPLAGRPLIAHTIEAALQATSVSRVIVSTDSREISKVAEASGAEIPFMRPAELAADTSPALDTYLYTCERLEREDGQPIEDFVVLLPTAPLRTSADIDNAIRLFKKKGADSVISVTEAECPIEWLKGVDEEGLLRDAIRGLGTPMANRQALAKVYRPNGAIYVFRHQFLLEKRNYYSDRTYAYVMPRERSVDIDTLLDFHLAEVLAAGQAVDRRGE